jgi:hypothetical protein
MTTDEARHVLRDLLPLLRLSEQQLEALRVLGVIGRKFGEIRRNT